MLNSYNQNRAIIFYSDDNMQHLAQMGLKNLLNVASLDCTELAALHKLTDGQGYYPVISVSDENLMRGVDYRSDNSGIVLVIAKTFATRRDAMQGLMRVGRFGDECVRFIVQGVELFNPMTNSTSY